MPSIFEDAAELQQAEQVVRSLARGLDPRSQTKLDHVVLFKDPEVIRALFFAAEALKQMGWRYRSRQKTSVSTFSVPDAPLEPNRRGQAWLKKEEAQLKAEFEAGKSIRELATCHGRSNGAIASRLVMLGCIPERRQAS